MGLSNREKSLFQYDARLVALSKQLDRLQNDEEAKRMALADYLNETVNKAEAEGITYLTDGELAAQGQLGEEDQGEEDQYDAVTLAERHGIGQVYYDWLLRRSLKMSDPPLEDAPCANDPPGEEWHCENGGKLACGLCKLVSYCSKECQRRHWKYHKRECKDPLRNSDWQPGWIREKRRTNFDVDIPRIWGNIPASDTLNLSHNELLGETKTLGDLSLAYIGSADLRDVILTVNALPSTFSGSLTIFLNAPTPPGNVKSSLTIMRSILTLLILDVVTDRSLAAEVAVHFWASAFVPSPHTLVYKRALQDFIRSVKTDQKLEREGGGFGYSFDLKLGKKETRSGDRDDNKGIRGIISEETWCLINDQLETVSSFDDGRKAYKYARFGPIQDDRHDRIYCRLQPSHRVAYSVFRAWGYTYPVGGPMGIGAPNPSLFAPLEGHWLQDDTAYPLDEWNIEEVVAAGTAHGCQSADLFGCLYFYLSDHMRTFAQRLRKFNIAFKFFECDPHVLARHLGEGTYVPLGLGVPVPEKLTFDRINFGGIGEFDYSFGDDHGVNSTNANATDSGIGLVLSDWAPFLNKKNPNSTMLGYFSNWVSKQRKSQPGPIEMKAITLQLLSKGRLDSQKMHPDLIPAWFKYFVALYDNSSAFEEFLAERGTDQAAQKVGVKRRTAHTIVPHRIGGQVGDPPEVLPHFATEDSWYWKVQVCQASLSERFVEFGLA